MTKIRDMAIMCVFTALIAVGAFIRVPIPVCPFTLQTFFIALCGIILGAKRGAVCAAVYVALGLIGAPVFVNGGGPAYVLQPTFGYLIGFIAGTYITGVIAHKGEPTVKRLICAGLAGLAVIYAVGVVYYGFMCNVVLGTPIGLWPLVLHCFLLTVPGDIVLCFTAAVVGTRVLPVLRKHEFIKD